MSSKCMKKIFKKNLKNPHKWMSGIGSSITLKGGDFQKDSC